MLHTIFLARILVQYIWNTLERSVYNFKYMKMLQILRRLWKR